MDLYSDLDGETNNTNGKHEEMESVDLYEDVLLPTMGGPHVRRQGVTGQPSGDGSNRKYQLYIGNLTWWTSDQDIANAIAGLGIRDLLDVKFFEHRPNGQSKGYCVVTFGSEQSIPICIQGLPKVVLHGNNPVVTFPTKQAFIQFEASCKPRSTPSNPTPQQQMMAINSAVLAPLSSTSIPPPHPITPVTMPPHLRQPSPQPPTAHWHGSPLHHVPPHRPPPLLPPRPPHASLESRGLPRPEWNRPPPPPGVVHNFRHPGVSMHRPPPVFPPPPAMNTENTSHVSTPFFPRGTPHVPPPLVEPIPRPPSDQGFNTPQQSRSNGCPPTSSSQQEYVPSMAPPKESNYEEIMARNRTVTSSAIARAVSDAAAGEFPSAIETLVTAISLIKHSETAKDERCRVLISSLQDTLQKVEMKSYGLSRRERSRSRDRERERIHRKYRRDRSRSREREYRDRSRDREREKEKERNYYDSYYRDRSRSKDRDREYRERSRDDRYDDRYRERDRERERERESRRETDRERERERDREREPCRKESDRDRELSRRDLERERDPPRRELDRERETSRRESERDRELSRRELERESSRRELEREKEALRRDSEKEQSRRNLEVEREPSSRELDKDQSRKECEKEPSRREQSRRDTERDREQLSRRELEWERESRRESARESSRRDSDRDRETSRRELERDRDREKYYKIIDKEESFVRETKQV